MDGSAAETYFIQCFPIGNKSKSKNGMINLLVNETVAMLMLDTVVE